MSTTADDTSGLQFSAGDVIIQTKPLVHTICHEFKGIFCDNCLKRVDPLKRCSLCLQMYYCGKECQKNDWKYHKNECKLFSHEDFLRDLFTSEEILLIRLFVCFKNGKSFATRRHRLVDGSDVSLEDIVVKYPPPMAMVYDDLDRNEEFVRISCHLKGFGMKFKNKELLHWFIWLASSPSHVGLKWYSRDMRDYQYFSDMVCRAVCLEVLPLNHSCLPNVAIITNGLSVQLRALRKIPIGEELTISYIRVDQKKSDRREALRRDFYRLEDCKCLKCDQNIDKDVNYSTYDQLIGDEILNFVDRRRVDSNYWSDYETLGSKLIPYYKSIYGDYHPFLTATLMQQSVTSRVTAILAAEPAYKWKPMVLQYYKTVDQHLRVTHGVDHPLFEIFYKVFARM